MWKNPVRKEKDTNQTVGTARDGEGGLRFTPENASVSLTHTLEHSPHTCFLSFTHIPSLNCDLASLLLWFVLSCIIRVEAHTVSPLRQDSKTKATLKVPLSCVFPMCPCFFLSLSLTQMKALTLCYLLFTPARISEFYNFPGND